MRLALKGHPTRGDEVIELLEMLGGKNPYKLTGDISSVSYTVASNNEILIVGDIHHNSSFIQYSLEEFEAEFPYKVRDIVQLIDDDESKYEIVSMRWTGSKIKYDAYGLNCVSNLYLHNAEKLKPYKQPTREEVMRDYIAKPQETMKNKGTLVEIDLTSELNIADKVRIILGDYEVKEEGGETYLVKKTPEYPKTFKECCKILVIPPHIDVVGYKWELLMAFQELLICRDAYWKIAGEQMGLDKPWQPDWTDNYQKKFTISYYQDEIDLTNGPNVHRLLAFPTEEMRDAFYENFKDLIEQCKELL